MNWRKPLIYLLIFLTGSKIIKNLKEILKVTKYENKKRLNYKNVKLSDLLLHAWNNVPYYRRLLSESEVIIDGKVYLENFKNVPILTKSIIRKEGEKLYSKDYLDRNPFKNTSGGSTGEPVRFIQDKYFEDWMIATKLYYKLLAKQNIGQKEMRLWGSERDLLLGQEKLSMRLRNFLYNRKELNSFKMSEKDMLSFVFKWNSFKPSWIEAYVQSIYEFAKFIQSKNLKIYSPAKGILTSAGTLYPEMKSLIEEVFNCKVYNRYGSREVGDMACSGDLDELHISFWNNYVEILNDDMKPCKKGETGKIYVTNLNNYSMPLIRYDIGDIGVKGDEFVLQKVLGRTVGVIKTKKGDLIDGEFFTHLFYFKNIIKFQVIQEEHEFIKIKVVLNNKKEFNKQKIEIEKSIKKVMTKNTKIQWVFVNKINSLKNGKYNYVVSKL